MADHLPVDPLLGLSPNQVAIQLAHLEHFVFLDSAGHISASASAPYSILAAQPEQIIQGNIEHPVFKQQLREALRSFPDASELGGLIGWIEYSGQATFGLYRNMLRYEHETKQWHELGNLSSQLQSHTDFQQNPIGDFEQEMSEQQFIAAVQKAKDWIAAGDIYQVNLSQTFTAKHRGSSLFPLYQHLRQASPAPMAAWLSLAGKEVLCSSPETFLKFDGKSIETRPIKGTRPRLSSPAEDTKMQTELLHSEKERAELIMITDLLRNDLGQVCEYHSVKVTEMLRLETLEQVHHLVSTVRGTLRSEYDALDALSTCFPGGSITGAPKKRAMEIIDELEISPRGLYCGSIGWLSPAGKGDFNIAIRSLIKENDLITYHVGAGIVADSDPLSEYQETIHKAAGIRLAIDNFQHQPTIS